MRGNSEPPAGPHNLVRSHPDSIQYSKDREWLIVEGTAVAPYQIGAALDCFDRHHGLDAMFVVGTLRYSAEHRLLQEHIPNDASAEELVAGVEIRKLFQAGGVFEAEWKFLKGRVICECI